MDEGLGKKLKKLRTAQGMTQDMVAKILHTTRQRYARMENGQADVSFQDIRMLADIFGISTSDLTAEENKERIRGVILHQKPEILGIGGMEPFLSLLDFLEEQERIYSAKSAGESREIEQGTFSGPENPDLYGMLRPVQRPAAVNSYKENLLSILERSGLEIIRYPFAQELLGMLVYNGRGYTLITSSSCPFEEEMRTAAFLAGEFYSKAAKCRQLLYVLTKDNYEETAVKERDAVDFAHELLIPGYALDYYIRYELRISLSQLRAIHTAQIQNYFQVSYKTVEKVLLKERLISREQVQKIHKGRRYYGEERLANMLGFSLEYLYRPWNRVQLPHIYVEHLLSNFENGYIPFVQLDRIMDLMQVPIGELAGLRKPQDDRDDWDDSWE
ncbi:MAG: helix-turn-helix domain-containing protein [Lachnospiraceae bacterium]